MSLPRRLLALLALLLALIVPAGAQAQANDPPRIGPAPDATVLAPAADGRPRVSFTAEPGLESQAARLAPLAEQYLARIEADLAGLPRVEHVEVRLVKHSRDLGKAAPPGRSAPAWAEGVAYVDAGVVVIAARGPSGQMLDMGQTLAHELAHMAIERALGDGRVPRWLHEGFAYQHSSELTFGRLQTLAAASFRGDIIPITRLEDRFPARHDEVSLAYAESYDFVGYLAGRGRWPDAYDDGDRSAFRLFLAEIAAGKGVDGAAREAYGAPIEQLDAEWRQRVRDRYFWYPIAALGGLFWALLGVLAVFAWRRKRKQKRLRLEAMGIEEKLAAEAARRAAEEAVRDAGDGVIEVSYRPAPPPGRLPN